MSVIFFSPHPDDETLACGGTIAKYIKDRVNVVVVFMTDGRASHKSVLNIFDPPPEYIKEIRYKEALTALKILGVKPTNIIFLNFFDGTLSENIFEAHKLVIEIFNKCRPNKIFYPMSTDFHHDHKATNLIIEEALKEVKLELDIEKYQYIIWRNLQENFIYPNLKELKIDISEELILKEQALLCYKSQIDCLFFNQMKPILSEDFLNEFLKPFEKFYLSSRL